MSIEELWRMFEFRSFRHVCLAVLKCYICVCISELWYKGDLVTILLIAVERLHESPILPFVVYVYTFWKYNDARGQNKNWS